MAPSNFFHIPFLNQIFLLHVFFCVALVSALPESLIKYRPHIPDFILRLQTGQSGWSLWEMVQVASICGALPGIWFMQKQLRRSDSSSSSWRSTTGSDEKVASIRTAREETITTGEPRPSMSALL